MQHKQVSQQDQVRMILFHEPHIVESISYVHPLASLFGAIPDFVKIRKGYKLLEAVFKKYNVHYGEVTDILMRDRKRLEQLARISCQYKPSEELIEEQNPTITLDYMNTVLSGLDEQSLLSIVYSRPKVILKKEPLNTFIAIERVDIHPLSNLIFILDQQIVTAKGLVLCESGTHARKFEHEVMRTAFDIVRIKPIGKLPPGCHLEGGDFMSINQNLALINIGLRSDFSAAAYLMEKNLLGTSRLGVLTTQDKSHARSHLDTYFNIINEKIALILDFEDKDVPKNARRQITIYQRQSNESPYLKQKTLDFEEFLIEEGFKLLKITNQEQLNYTCNFLNLGRHQDKQVLVTSSGFLSDIIRRNEIDSAVTVEYIQEFKQVHKMGGSLHGATQAFR